MNTHKKILFMDLDGTLLNDEKEITAGNRAAILDALNHGHKIVISTGRALSCAIELAQRLKLTMNGCYIIAFNGGCVYDMYHRRLVYHAQISKEYVRILMDMAHKLHIHAHTYGDSCVLAERDCEDLQIYAANTHMGYKIVPDVCTELGEDPCKVLVVDYKNHELLEAYREAILDWAKGKADCFFSCRELLEVVPPGVSKGNAIRILCRELGIDMEDTISAGDAENDISMLQVTKESVVMKNAESYMHPYATYITEHDNNHDGMAEIIYKFMVTDGFDNH